MNICCLYCGSEKMEGCFAVEVVDHEVNQRLKCRHYKCARCHKIGTLKWWEVFVNGKILISPVSGFQWKAE